MRFRFQFSFLGPSYLKFRCVLSRFNRAAHICGRDVPAYILLPPYVQNKSIHSPTTPVVHTPDDIAKLRFAGNVVRQIFEELEKYLKPGLSTQDVDDFVFSTCMSKRVYPSPLGYRGFPKSVCTSVNEVACHGIPSSQQMLLPGDLLSIDISVYTKNGVHGDACRSYVLKPEAGYSSRDCPSSGRTKLAVFLCSVAKSCRDAGIAICAPGTPYTEIARVVSSTADRNGCRVVAGIRGHGVGTFLHGPPDIIHSVHEISLFSTDESAGQMKEGHVFTIEPCITLAVANTPDQKDGTSLSPACPTVLQDGWTVVTSDRTLTAQFEHTIVITSTGHSILT